MSEVTVYSGHRVKTIKPYPSESIEKVVEANVQEVQILRGQVGNKSWIVIYDGEPRMKSLENKVSEMENTVSEMENTVSALVDLLKMNLRNLVVQILLFLKGSQPKHGMETRTSRKTTSMTQQCADAISMRADEFKILSEAPPPLHP
jgi:uncharacterized protein YceH (UPF0502 family)